MSGKMRASQNCLRLLMDYEKGPSDGSVPLSPGGAALAPYICPGGELTIGYGCCKWFDGEDVAPTHRLSGEEEAQALLLHNLTEYENAVNDGVQREPTQSQFDGFVSRCFNIGIAAFLSSSALKSFNEGRIEDAAANFGKWTGATCDRPPLKQRKDPAYASKIGRDHKGNARWIGPEGQYCRYMLRLEGLLSRCYADALLFMDKDHRRALRSAHGIELKLIPTDPSAATWNARKGRWEDEVRFKTSFKDVLAFAYFDELPNVTTPMPSVTIIQEASSEPAEKIIAPSLPNTPTKPIDLKPLDDAEDIPSSELPELVLEKPALIVVPDEVADRPAPSPVQGSAASAPKSTPASVVPVESGGSGQAAAKNPVPPASPPPVPPVVAKPPPPPVVIAPKQIDVRSIPYGELGENPPAKNMSDSTRVVGMVIVGIGSIVQILAGREIISSTIGAVFFDMSRDPVLVALGAGAVVMVFGWLTRKRGTQILTKGMVQAQTVLK